MKKYTTLLFDADDTLLDFKKSEATALELMMKERGLPFKNGDAELYSRVNQSFWEAYQQGVIEKSEILVGRYKKFFEIKGIETNAFLAAKTYERFLSEQHFVIHGVMEALEKLQRDYEIYIITNGTDYIQKKRLKDSGITALTKGLFISEVVGAPKPEKQYFDYVLNNITEKDKSKVLIIGDSMSSDILGGINAGIDTCWYNPQHKKAEYMPSYEISNFSDIWKVLL